MYKYQHLLNELESKLERRLFKEGDKLPSVQALTTQYGCSKSTVLRMLSELEKRHMIYSIPKSGYYVVKGAPGEEQKASSSFIDFAASTPDPDVFPYLDFQHCINKAIDTYKNNLFRYGTLQGLPSLIRVVQKHLASHQVFANERNIVITSGIQQALAILAALPFPNRKTKILVEQPCYHLFLALLENGRVPALGIQRTAEGIDLEQLETIFRTENIKLFYTMPRFHHPLGTSYSRQEKEKIAELARKYDVFIVEDDQMADLEQDRKRDPLYAYDLSSRVIYLKSYSKIIFPGLRIGVAVVPESLVGAFVHSKKLQDIDSSMLSQGALEIYLKSGMFERHKEKIRTSYTRRATIMAACLQECAERSNGRFTFSPPAQPSIHTHICLPPKLPLPPLLARLKKQSILLEPIDKHYLSSFPKANLLKLNVSQVKEEEIERGIRTIAEAIEM
ncbi:PLP-dependent aminotransferase family protein [Cohnella sp. REN36]|uniref:aminotransferase-like domain-containing protein n=1 Tax=Cohnella sp. REN36 TaxID=2887347 RepID=UPI001D13DCCD|nr:PLP-dependent aminotransferase family protein [Cohnella sp. REN36]MCC3372063.1 PLP-dependent aminotransferase family protein [Cohnella sp. REN36]